MVVAERTLRFRRVDGVKLASRQLRDLKATLGVAHEEMADRLDVPLRTYYSWIQGEYRPTFEAINAIMVVALEAVADGIYPIEKTILGKLIRQVIKNLPDDQHRDVLRQAVLSLWGTKPEVQASEQVAGRSVPPRPDHRPQVAPRR